MTKTRIKWIDVCKGLGIIIVILGHYIQTLYLNYGGIYTEIFYWIYSFHMPMFFFLSGLVYKKYTTKAFFTKKAKGLLIPVLFFSALYTLYKFVIIGDKSDLLDILMCKSDSFIHLYWFVWTLLWVQVLFFILESITKNRFIVFILSIAVLIFCMTGNYRENLLNLPLCIGNTLFLLPFYIAGVLTKGINFCKLIRFFVIIFSMDLFICWIYKFGTSYALLAFKIWPLDYLKAILGTMILISASIIVSKTKLLSSILQEIGKESLWIYLVHGFFFWGLFKKGINIVPQSTVAILIYTLLMTTFTILTIHFMVFIYKKWRKAICNAL